jgi:hypothetical protein
LQQYLWCFVREQPNRYIIHSSAGVSPSLCLYDKQPPTLTKYIDRSTNLKAIHTELSNSDTILELLCKKLVKWKLILTNSAWTIALTWVTLHRSNSSTIVKDLWVEDVLTIIIRSTILNATLLTAQNCTAHPLYNYLFPLCFIQITATIVKRSSSHRFKFWQNKKSPSLDFLLVYWRLSAKISTCIL